MVKLVTTAVDSIGKACSLLERLAEVFAADHVDYEFSRGSNRFLVLRGDVWHAVTFSDTQLLLGTLDQLESDVLRMVYGTQPNGRRARSAL